MAHTRSGDLKDVPSVCCFVSCCADNNECELEPCGHGRGHCVNTDGSFKCLCRQGYKHMVQQGRPKCIGEYEGVSSSCFSGGRQTLDCSCPFSCADLNECSKQDICGVGGQCVNLLGSYKCECHRGFRIKSHRHPICEGAHCQTVVINSSVNFRL